MIPQAFFDVPVLTLQALLFRIFGGLREVTDFTGEERGTPVCAARPVSHDSFPIASRIDAVYPVDIQLSSIVEANQMNNGVAGIESAR